MNLAGGFPFGFNPEEETKRSLPKKQFANAQCPQCKTPQPTQVLTEEFKAQNLVCINCRKGFCSFCNGKKHWIGECTEAVEARRSSQVPRNK
ncbi:unnamed protein product [Blepharisma stoltei]|uniref:IBR domain-containing protein n=1 Tax=Blepharisma stoltei TaxID=1481888 RepID=A0AAU9K3N2_9CILI|nr:unnamed protein product [Blepharisma stoltei]